MTDSKPDEESVLLRDFLEMSWPELDLEPRMVLSRLKLRLIWFFLESFTEDLRSDSMAVPLSPAVLLHSPTSFSFLKVLLLLALTMPYTTSARLLLVAPLPLPRRREIFLPRMKKVFMFPFPFTSIIPLSFTA